MHTFSSNSFSLSDANALFAALSLFNLHHPVACIRRNPGRTISGEPSMRFLLPTLCKSKIHILFIAALLTFSLADDTHNTLTLLLHPFVTSIIDLQPKVYPLHHKGTLASLSHSPLGLTHYLQNIFVLCSLRHCLSVASGAGGWLEDKTLYRPIKDSLLISIPMHAYHSKPTCGRYEPLHHQILKCCSTTEWRQRVTVTHPSSSSENHPLFYHHHLMKHH